MGKSRHGMRRSSHMVSREGFLVCPMCEAGELDPGKPFAQRCGSCGYVVDLKDLAALRQIIALPDAVGGHACECGHPEMRRLPDGVYWCPSCGSEVVPHEPAR